MKAFTSVVFASTIVLLPVLGCVVVVDRDGDCSVWGWGEPRIWTSPVTERLALDAAGMESLVVRTHNGSVDFAPTTDGGESFVEVTRKTSGRSLGDAEEAENALEVYVESSGGARHVGYRWKGLKKAHWGAHVSFRIHAPANLKLDVETHNGPVTANGINGAVRLVSHNGGLTVTSGGGTLYGETHNGQITATYSGDDVRLTTHNGAVTANLSGCGRISGDVTTHNGRVEVIVGQQTSTKLSARTHNGGMTIRVPLDDSQISGRSVTGSIGAGEGRLEVTTHNGGVTVTNKAG